MNKELTICFKKYEALAQAADKAFQKVKADFSELLKCRAGCTDCCYALFDLTLIEAMYIKHHFDETFTDDEKASILEKANQVDRKIYRLKKAAFKAVQGGEDESRVIENIAKERIRCPLLMDEDRCALYPYRPIACRIYGAPLSIGGKGRTCGMAGFEPGNVYPSINMDALHDQLIRISEEFVRAIESKHEGLFDVLVPLSMALLTEYSDEYLGLSANPEENAKEEDVKGDNSDG